MRVPAGGMIGFGSRLGRSVEVANVQDLMRDAMAVVPRVRPDEARARMADEDALLVDVREAHEIALTGKAQGALAVPLGELMARADPESGEYDPAFRKDRTIILYCAVGARSALGGKFLLDLGYATALNLGAFDDWLAAGLETESG